LPSDLLEITGDCRQSPCFHPLCKMGGVTGQLRYLPVPGGQVSKTAALVSAGLGRTLAETDRIKFRAAGTCMYPVIKPGDILNVDPKDISQFRVGDIAVYQRNNHLFGHRIIKKGLVNGRTHIITKQDRATPSDDGPSYAEDVLGVVTHIERSGKIVSPEPRDYNLTKKLYFELCAFLLKSLNRCFPTLSSGLTWIQQTVLYRKFARIWFEYSNPELRYSLQVPFISRHGDGLHRRLTLTEFQGADFLRPCQESKYFLLELFVSDPRRPAVSATFVFRPCGCFFAGWWLDNLRVRISHRGAGLEEKLLDEAKKVFGNLGVKELWVGPDVRLPGPIKWVRPFAF
jgi:signal peptidase I